MKTSKIVFEHELIEATINFNRNDTTTFEFDLPKSLDLKGLENLRAVIKELELYVAENN
ncbi:MAG: hypothetical protein GPJ51_06555 [Candidatus Heimdallarchaeota archaeon]|nr:hypothetical protein [Candidatus Heimdallarchaeota archaeon]